MTLPAGIYVNADDSADAFEDAVPLHRMAVSAKGAAPGLSVCSASTAGALKKSSKEGESLFVVLDHLGPSAIPPAGERPEGLSALKSLQTGRRAAVLSDEGWSVVAASYESAMVQCEAQQLSCGLSMERGLLQTALSPIGNAGVSFEKRLERVLSVVGAHKPFVLLSTNELCPGGIDPAMSAEIVQALLAKGIGAVVACTGSDFLPALKEREAAMQNPAALFLRAALPTLEDAQGAPVFARGFCDEGPASFYERAKALGFAGVLFDARTFLKRRARRDS